MKRQRFLVIVVLILIIPVTLWGLTVEEEKKYGKEIYQQIAGSTPINSDPYISLYLPGIKGRLEDASTQPFPITLTVIDSPTINAFATIGGYIYVTTGLIGLCDTEEELAGVLSHELAHITRRHVAKRLEKEKYLNIGMIAAALAAALVGEPAVMTMGMASAQAMSLKYSRDHEEDADRVGAVVAHKAGYDASAIAIFLKKLRSAGGEATVPEYLLTHPIHENRISNIETAWRGSRTTVNTAFFPYVAVRANVLHGPLGSGVKEIWLKRYSKDPDDAMAAYGASLAQMTAGNINESAKIIAGIRSPYKALLMGEMLVKARKFKEAVEALKDQRDPVQRYFLALAYEGQGDGENALTTLRSLVRYGPSYPQIYYRLGMIAGRTGNEGEGYAYLGRYYLEIGNYELAKTNLEKAVSKFGINSSEGKELLRILDGMKKQG